MFIVHVLDAIGKIKSQRYLLLILINFTIFASTYSLITPAFEGPDEDGHYGYSEVMARSLNTDSDFWGSYWGYITWAPLYYVINAGFIDMIEEPGHHLYSPEDTVDPNYPFVDKTRFYHGEEEIFPYSGVAKYDHTLRFFSVFCGLVTLIFIYKTATIVFQNNKWLPIFSTAVVSLIPTFVWLSSVMTNDVLVMTLSTITIYFLFRYMNEPDRKSLLAMTAVFAALAVSTKANGLIVYPLICIGFAYAAYTKKCGIKNIIKKISIFALFTFLSSWWVGIVRIIRFPSIGDNPSIFKLIAIALAHPNIFSANQSISTPVDLTEGIRRITDYNFLHTRFQEFALGGMGWNVLWPPHYYFDITDYLLLASIVGLVLLVVFRRRVLSEFKIKRIHMFISFTGILIVIGTIYVELLFSEVGLIRYTFPMIVGYGLLIPLGWYVLVNGRKRLKLILFIPLIFLAVLNIQDISIIHESLGIITYPDSNKDGIPDVLDTVPFTPNEFNDKKLGGTTTGTIIYSSEPISSSSLSDTTGFVSYVYDLIQKYSPNFAQLQEKIPAQFFENNENRIKTLNQAINELEQEGKITRYGDAWQITTQRILVAPADGGVLDVKDLDPISSSITEVDACGGIAKFHLNRGDEIRFSCNDNTVNVHVNQQVVEIIFTGIDGSLANSNISQGNGLKFQQKDLTFTADIGNSGGNIIVQYNGISHSLNPGDSISLKKTIG